MDKSTDSLCASGMADGEKITKSILDKRAALQEPHKFVEAELLPRVRAWEACPLQCGIEW